MRRRSGASRPRGGPLIKDLLDVNIAYKRFLRWVAGEAFMEGHWRKGTAPRHHIGLLLNLKGVVTIGHKDLAVVKKEFNKPLQRGQEIYWQSYRNESRREVETMLAYSVFHSELIEDRHLDVFCRALHDAGAGLGTLALRSGLEIDAIKHASAIKYLRRLELNTESFGFDGIVGPELYSLFDKLLPASSWAESLRALEELSIAVAPTCKDYGSVFSLFLEMSFPKLRSVYMKRLRLTYGWLSTFVHVHRSTIRSLRIEEPRIIPGDWSSFRSQERESQWEAMEKKLHLTESCLQG